MPLTGRPSGSVMDRGTLENDRNSRLCPSAARSSGSGGDMLTCVNHASRSIDAPIQSTSEGNANRNGKTPVGRSRDSKHRLSRPQPPCDSTCYLLIEAEEAGKVPQARLVRLGNQRLQTAD